MLTHDDAVVIVRSGFVIYDVCVMVTAAVVLSWLAFRRLPRVEPG